ncbi:MAG: fibronectin type III domain-containing protein [candidate division Zixibacteria bacterium]|nr:fibronectin type III domain-containing protein [candidate division Zixibacteria bacterium]MBU1472001.1 fibronectin type III domain-containing protein [candidate division Zixibacteria bacterium]MBU2626525.1 fibronectin type III domain-containing protein [candidate division Zixibacteria bacterium]
MARFPRTEAEILALAQEMAVGLAANVAIYPAPPVSTIDLTTALSDYTNAKNAAVAAQAAAEQATTDKDVALEDLTDALKTDIRYAENTVDFDDDKLKLIGWAGRAASTALELPGQPRLLETVQQGEGWVMLDWKAPSEGGKPSAYKVMRRERPSGEWADEATAVLTEITLVNRDRSKEWEYRIVATNKVGDGPASNTVMAVL